ncbi:MAG: hypothetical protein DME01_26635 [Candidatus Rokuibacteriota bacterium]|nr:MAG: hypothetical protein DME01_26635 [Candidatus Rokubacteria bacterium]
MTRNCAVLMLAWVAWTHATFPSKDIDQWTPGGATETLDECKQAAVTSASDIASKFRPQNDPGTVVTRTGAVIEMAFASGEKAYIAIICLPDTVDPRGMKEK